MRSIQRSSWSSGSLLPALVLALAASALAACNKKEAAPEGAPASPVPVRCPAGSVIQDGACVAVLTAAQVQAVGQQQAKLDELARLLARSDVVLAPVELLASVRESALWKKVAARSESLASADEVVASLGVAAPLSTITLSSSPLSSPRFADALPTCRSASLARCAR